jgi:hypothetical protein
LPVLEDASGPGLGAGAASAVGLGTGLASIVEWVPFDASRLGLATAPTAVEGDGTGEIAGLMELTGAVEAADVVLAWSPKAGGMERSMLLLLAT